MNYYFGMNECTDRLVGHSLLRQLLFHIIGQIASGEY
jgi:hypothetical protein